MPALCDIPKGIEIRAADLADIIETNAVKRLEQQIAADIASLRERLPKPELARKAITAYAERLVGTIHPRFKAAAREILARYPMDSGSTPRRQRTRVA